jgi:hypothetical protein
VQFDAFWVPGLDSDVDQDDSLPIAFEWLARAERTYGGRGLLVMNAVKMVDNDPAITRAASRWPLVSPQSRRHSRQAGGPVVCVWPATDRTVQLAEFSANGKALCMIAGSLMSLEPWIRKTSAMCLMQGFEVGPGSPIPGDIRNLLDSMIRFGGHNAFLGGGEKEHAIRCMRLFASRPDAPSPDELEAYLRSSQGVERDGATRAGTWYERIRAGRSFRDYGGRAI